ncbi:M48 family metallopeptidase [Nitratifractor sp.]|uniref:M48 family metallopeptidase n=1 Tax=Nitratifractor sp. TaxID=2268144 RepID=UPI0025E36027|nr:M48 family metallopeptidase [Nitratifractor sp.]
MLLWIVGIYTLYTLVKIYLSVMEIGYVNVEKRRKPVLMPQGRYFVAGNYAIAKERLAIVQNFVEYLLFLWWVLAGFRWLQGIVGIQESVGNAVLFLFAFFGINWLVNLPFEIYAKFKIDQSFGFNKTTPKMYLIDTLKSIALFVVIGGPILAALAWVIAEFRDWWIWGFVLLFAVALLANVIYPTIIAPIFNKFTPLPEGELRDAIEKMMAEAGLRSDGIFVMDASKRDSRLNAYFGGLGKAKRVVLFDTLLDKLNDKELLAVLGHELGHYKHGDIWKNIAMMGGFLFVAFYIFGHLPQRLYLEMGVVPTAGVTLATIALLLPVLAFVYTPLMSMLSRHNEYEADRYGAEAGGRQSLISALLKLVGENKTFPKSDPIYSRFYYSHPPILERLEALGYDPERVDMDAELPKEGIFEFLEQIDDADDDGR